MARMVRTQILFTPEQAERLHRLARERGVSMAALVREAVDAAFERDDREDRWQRALAMIGKYRSKDRAADVAENHDKYLAEIYHDW
jgi:predicted DNA-binding protein